MLRSLKMLVLPLVAGCMVASVCALGEAGSGMGRIASWTLGSFLLTNCIAAALGVALAVVALPGHQQNSVLSGPRMRPLSSTYLAESGLDLANGGMSTPLSIPASNGVFRQSQDQPAQPKHASDALLKLLRDLIPDNIAAAAANMNILGVIFFSVFFGTALSLLRHDEGCKQIISGVEAFNKIIIQMVTAIIYISPLGIASLIAASICKTDDLAKTLAALGSFFMVYIAGLALLCLALYHSLFWLLTRKSPALVYRAFAQALITVFGTDSSIATLPVTLRCAAQHGISDAVARFVLPLGANINMNGTALFEALTVIYIAQTHHVTLNMAQLMIIWMCAVLAAISAAAIPSAGLVTMVMVMQAADLDAYLEDIGIIFALDWLLDRCRSVPNVLGDCFVCALVQHKTTSLGRASSAADSHLHDTLLANHVMPAA